MEKYLGSKFGLPSGFEKDEAVVLEVGSRFTRAGFSGEAQPRLCLPTQMSSSFGEPVLLESLIGVPGHELTSEQWRRALTRFLVHVFVRKLQCTPKEHKVVICEAFVSPEPFRRSLAWVLFHRLQVPGVMFVPGPALPLLLLDAIPPAVLMVNIGWAESSVLPIVHGKALPRAWTSVRVGMRSAAHRVRHLLTHHGLTRSLDVDEEEAPLLPLTQEQGETWFAETGSHVETMLRGATFVLPRTESPNATKQEPNWNDTTGPLDSDAWEYAVDVHHMLLVTGTVRAHFAEALFEGDEEGQSLATMVLQCLSKCAVDVRVGLASHMVLTGGGSCLRGLETRLVQELSHLSTQADAPWTGASGLAQRFACLPFPLPGLRPHLVWAGGSVFGGCLGVLDRDDGLLVRRPFLAGEQEVPECAPVATPLLPVAGPAVSGAEASSSIRVYRSTPKAELGEIRARQAELEALTRRTALEPMAPTTPVKGAQPSSSLDPPT